MNKAEWTIVILLVALLLVWGSSRRAATPPPSPVVSETVLPAAQGAAAGANAEAPAVAAAAAIQAPAEIKASDSAQPVEPAVAVVREPEKLLIVSNDVASFTVSSWGASVKAVELKKHRSSTDKKSPPVVLDFVQQEALSMDGFPGLGMDADFELSADNTGKSVQARKVLPSGLAFTRTITMGDDYVLDVTDSFVNASESAATIPAREVRVGPMRLPPSVAAVSGLVDLGVDTLQSTNDAKVVHWSSKGPAADKANILERFRPEGARGGCAMFKPKLQTPLAKQIRVEHKTETAWIGVKSRFFVQTLAPVGGSSGFTVSARRTVPEFERLSEPGTWAQEAVLKEVSGSLLFKEETIPAGGKMEKSLRYYAGPKKMSLLKKMGGGQDEVMEFGFFRPVCKVLVTLLNGLYWLLPNYGVAVILLTVIVRLVFWPVTHKSTVDMKKLREIQPLVTAIREKFKDNPQKLHQETMALYKQYKVNPLSGCLPMLVQIPVFIALFTVLRSAVELRFAPFLWVADLSAPERLLEFGFTIPLLGWDSLNLWPIAMIATMVWQQKLTPTAGDPQQQKMMLILMPAMMLFFFYNMPSALVIYWTVSQCLSIVQLILQERKASHSGTSAKPASAALLGGVSQRLRGPNRKR